MDITHIDSRPSDKGPAEWFTGTVHLGTADQPSAAQVLRRLESKVGRVIVNGYPTCVEVCNAIVHGGPYPATTDPGSTSVGASPTSSKPRIEQHSAGAR